MRIVAALCCLLVMSCGSHVRSAAPTDSPAASTSPPAWTADPSHVFRAGPGIPAGSEPCAVVSDVEAALNQFADAFNSGDAAAIRSSLSPEFWALSLSVRGHHEVAYAQEDAVRYVLERQRAGDRLEFRRVQVNDLVGWDGAAHIGPVAFVLRRGAAEIELDGKGALYCGGSTQGIKVLGLGS